MCHLRMSVVNPHFTKTAVERNFRLLNGVIRRRIRDPNPREGKILKNFSDNYYAKFGHFSGKNRIKFGNFVDFSDK